MWLMMRSCWRFGARLGLPPVFIGIESSGQECLEETHKLQNRQRDMVADVLKLYRYSLQVQAGFIVGFDRVNPILS